MKVEVSVPSLVGCKADVFHNTARISKVLVPLSLSFLFN